MRLFFFLRCRCRCCCRFCSGCHCCSVTFDRMFSRHVEILILRLLKVYFLWRSERSLGLLALTEVCVKNFMSSNTRHAPTLASEACTVGVYAYTHIYAWDIYVCGIV